MTHAARYNAEQIAVGHLTYDMLPASLRVLVDAADVWEPGHSTLATMTPEQSVAFARAVSVWQRGRGLEDDGAVGPQTTARMELVTRYEAARGEHTGGHYRPHSAELSALLSAACEVLQLDDIGAMPQAHEIIRRESGGWVGRPNYRIRLHGKRVSDPQWRVLWPAVHAAIRRDPRSLADESGVLSTACGLGQLLSSNMARYAPGHLDRSMEHYAPDGVADYGQPLGEAIAYIGYVLGRYQAPGASVSDAVADAWTFYELPRFAGLKSERPKGCVYGWQALARHGGPGRKPGEGY